MQVPLLAPCLSLLTGVRKGGQTSEAQKWHCQVKDVAPPLHLKGCPTLKVRNQFYEVTALFWKRKGPYSRRTEQARFKNWYPERFSVLQSTHIPPCAHQRDLQAVSPTPVHLQVHPWPRDSAKMSKQSPPAFRFPFTTFFYVMPSNEKWL